MGFVKREVPTNFVSLGDGEGDVKRVAGLLVRFVENRSFDKPKTDYEYVDKNGELQILSGSASLSRQIHGDDLGKFFKAEFEGWGKSANGKFKQITVYVWDGELNDAMKAWPRLKEFYGRGAQAPAAAAAKPKAESTDDFPASLQDEDDDLPF